ncbi:exo-alpha-sialidase [Oleiharenicola lentus]|uniref:exo-alpha-sialidase n=1 Tax=Oleiharenicola lentus TaxID=2508720 RepID=UPI003F660CD8
MKRLNAFLCSLFLAVSVFSARAETNSGLSTRQSLDGTWQFALAPNVDEADKLRKFYADTFDASAFKPIPVPSNWTTHGFEEPHYVNGTTSEGFYLYHFNPPESVKGKRTLLHFGGVWQSAEVWLNGKLLGRHDSGFTAFAFDVSSGLLPGAQNRLAVRVRQQTPLFKLDANDDWALPGIFRSVWLETMPKEWNLESVEVVTDFDDNFRDATLKIRAHVMRNEKADFFADSPPFEVRAILSTRDGKEVQRTNFTAVVAGAHNGFDAPLAMRVKEPASWNAETPNLYRLRVELLRDDKVQHAWEDLIGFREISTANGIFRINGQIVKLHGVAAHDQHPDVGRATRREHWIEDIRLMKAGNINAVRTAHYPHAEGFIRLCDELGLYVIEEVPYGFGGDRLSDPSYAEGAFLRVHETIKRDRNRPSVVVWSIGNEDPFSSLHLATVRAVKGLDATRPTLFPFRFDAGLPPEIDIVAPHYWKADDYDNFLSRATRPLITTEFSHALGADDFGEQAERWDAIRRHPSGAGGMIWLWADQGLRRKTAGNEVLDPMLGKAKITREGAEFVRESDAGKDEIYDAHGNYGTDGIVDANRTPQIDYWETKSAYAPVQVLAERLDFKPGQPHVLIPLRNDYDFTDLSTVRAEWTIYRGAKIVARGREKLSGAPHSHTRLKLPTDSIKRDAPASGYYVHFAFYDPKGHELNRRSVRLGDLGEAARPPVAPADAKVTVADQDGKVTLIAGAARYVFDSKTGSLAALEIGGAQIAEASTAVVWRPPTYSERNVLDRRKDTRAWESYLQNLPPKATKWNVTSDTNGSVIQASVEYRADDKNGFTVDYTYRVANDGALTIDYVTKAKTEVESLLEIGVELKLVDQPFTAEWLGYGPGKNLPNRRASALFGQWNLPLFSGEVRGPRSGVEWLRVHGAKGNSFEVRGIEAFNYFGASKEGVGGTMRLLNHIAGAWVKGGPPERSEWRLDLKDGQGEFSGHIELRPLTNQQSEADAPKHPAVISSSLINANASYPESHASTIVEIAPGQLGAAWFGGTKERNPDVVIWFARQENGQWLPAKEVANGIQKNGPRLPTWNPVLFAPKGGPLVLFFKVGPSPAKWWGEFVTSTDGGKTWSKPVRLPDQDGILGPIKNKPVQLADGAWLSASSIEGTPTGWRAHFELSTDQGKTWKFIGPVEKGPVDLDMIQGSILFHKDGRLQTLGRTREGVLATSFSADQGSTWAPLASSGLPNPNSGTDAVTLRDGRQLLIYNHTAPPPERPSKGVRYPLNLAISDDGVIWRTVATLEVVPRAAGYAYPAIIQAADGKVHATYTFDRKQIKHVVIDPEKL